MDESELSQLVVGGAFSDQTEICRANGHWIALHERDEVQRVLGVVPPSHKISKLDRNEDTLENTLTRTDTKREVTAPPKAAPKPIEVAPVSVDRGLGGIWAVVAVVVGLVLWAVLHRT